MGEVAWVGRGSLGRDDGRIALVPARPRGAAPVGRADGVDRPPVRATRRSASTSRRRGASFYRELFAAAGGGSDREVLDALWDLVWAGEVTNDTFAPLRALRWKRPARDARRRPGPADVARAARGRRPLVARRAATTRTRPPRRAHADGAPPRARLALLDRHGVVTREAVAGGGRRGRVLGGLPGPAGARGGRPDPARLLRRRARRRPVRARRARSSGCAPLREPAAVAAERDVHLLAAADPANPYGAAIPWPRRGEDDRRPLQRAAGAYVVLVDGVAALYLERGGGTLQTLPAADDPEVGERPLRALRRPARRRPGPRARHHQGRRRAGRRVAVPRAPGRRRASCPAIAASSAPLRRGRSRAALGALTTADARGRHAPPDGRRARAAPRRPDRSRRPARGRPGPQVERVVGATIDARRGAGQEPADPVRQRPRAADPPPDERLVAPLPAGRALAPPAGPGAARHRGPGRGRGLLRRAGRRAVRDSAPRRSTRRSRRSGRTSSTPLRDRTQPPRRVRRLRDPARAGADDLGGAARPAGARRDRQHLAERDPVRRAGRSVGARRATSTTRPSTASSRPPAGCSATSATPRRAGRRCASTAGPAGRARAAARSIRSAPLADRDPADDLLVPDLPAGGRPMSGDRRRVRRRRPGRLDLRRRRSARTTATSPSTSPRGARRPRPPRAGGDAIRPTSSSARSTSSSSASRRGVDPADVRPDGDRPLLPGVRGEIRRSDAGSGPTPGRVYRGRCASTTSPGPPSRSGSTSSGRSPSASSDTGWPGFGWGAAWLTADGGIAAHRDVRAFRDDPGADDVGAHRDDGRARPPPPAIEAVDPPARRHPAVRRPGRPLRVQPQRRPPRHPRRAARYQAQGRIHGRADTEVGARWLEDAWATARARRPPSRPPRDVRRPGEPRRSTATDGAVVHYAGNTENPVFTFRLGRIGIASTAALLDRPVALPARGARRDGAPPRPARQRRHARPQRDGQPR